ncbi:MAG: hypothetical protein AAF215_17405 [Cyanobacteria bacterium P01_A01_bin.123]
MQLAPLDKPCTVSPLVTGYTALNGWPHPVGDGRAAIVENLGNPNPPLHQTQDIVVLPSMELPPNSLKHIKGVKHNDEQLRCWLMQLLNPGIRLIYITSQPIDPDIIDNHLKRLSASTLLTLRDRLILLSTYSSSCKSLAETILERPCLIHQIRQVLRPHCAVMASQTSTRPERELAMTLGIPLCADTLDLLY